MGNTCEKLAQPDTAELTGVTWTGTLDLADKTPIIRNRHGTQTGKLPLYVSGKQAV